jgi:hypothetical protein
MCICTIAQIGSFSLFFFFLPLSFSTGLKRGKKKKGGDILHNFQPHVFTFIFSQSWQNNSVLLSRGSQPPKLLK